MLVKEGFPVGAAFLMVAVVAVGVGLLMDCDTGLGDDCSELEPLAPLARL